MTTGNRATHLMQQGMHGVQPGLCILRAYCARRGDIRYLVTGFLITFREPNTLQQKAVQSNFKPFLQRQPFKCVLVHMIPHQRLFWRGGRCAFRSICTTITSWPLQMNRVRWDVPPLWGLQLPAVEVFEMFVSAQQMLILAALGWAFGWRIVLFLAIVCKLLCTADASAP